MGAASNYLELELLDHVFGKGAYTPPTVYAALFTSNPDEDASGTEVSGGSYARKSTVAGDWNAASSGAIDNANAITFTTATADWGLVTHVALYDAESAGHLLFYGELTDSKQVYSGDTVTIAAGDIEIQLD